MLNRLEAAYLNILRVVILVAATLALLVAALGLISAFPLLLEKAGITSSQQANASLGDFIAEKKLTETVSAPSAEAAAPSIPRDLAAVARNIHQYLGTRSPHPVGRWEDGLADFHTNMPFEAQDDYAASVKRLSEDLLGSKGRPLSLERVEELLGWHYQRFTQNLQDRAAAQAAADAQFYLTMGGAVTAFLVFVFVVFIFLFVKIERSLRLVRTVRAEEEAAPDGPAHA